MDAARRLLAPLLLALVLAGAFARPLVVPPIVHHGEAREGLVVQGILDSGNWVLPRRNGELPSKPPLFHWIAAVATKWLGFSDAVVRLPSALAAWVVACCVLAIGRTRDRATGWLAVGALLGMVPFLTSAIEARVDMVLTACMTTALAAFFLWYRAPTRAGCRVLVYLVTGAAVLAKGPIGVILPVLVIVGFLAVERDLGRVRALWSWPLATLLAALTLGWYVLAALSGGHEFVALHLMRENWQRLIGSHEFRRQARGRTLRPALQLATQYLPWTLAVLWSLMRVVRGGRSDVSERFLHAWWMTVLVLFTAAAGKRPVYLLPAAPPVALLAGRALGALAGSRRRLAALATMLVVADASVLATVQVVREHRGRRQSLLAFAGDVARLVPGAGRVCASRDVRWSDRMVLAYRLRRPVPAWNATCDDGSPHLEPVRADRRDGESILAASGDRRDDLALAVEGPVHAAARP